MGENGAGKSTLMKILSGQYAHNEYSGQISSQNKVLKFSSPKEAEEFGVAIIHQELSVFPDLSVAENFFVGRWPVKNGLVDEESQDEEAGRWIHQIDNSIDPHQIIRELNTGQQQVVEIAKALAKQAKVIVFDEPTSSLTQKETERLFEIIQKLKSQGCSVVYISHRMEEIFRISDRIAVLRDGQSVFSAKTLETTEAQIIQAMVGRTLDQLYPERKHTVSHEKVFSCRDFKATHKQSQKLLGPLSFDLHQGEILGFAGLLGSGRSEILSALLGDDTYESEGVLEFKEKNFSVKDLLSSYKDGIGLIPEDRKFMSLLPSRSLHENSSITRVCLNSVFTRLNEKDETEKSEEELKRLKTKFHSSDQLITDLSGGNQQKVILSRVIQNNPSIIILDEPTRGVDVGAKFEIYQLIREWTAKGVSVLLVSSDLPELMALSDRMIVMSLGRPTAQLEKRDFDQEKIMRFALEGFSK
jgi:ABC-type sugar transport system ATPase subunit